MWRWPLENCTPMFPDEPGQFGSVRKYDRHTGIDLYAERGSRVVAVESGVVVLVEGFTGTNAADPSPWWNDTQAVLIEGASGVVVYGEIQSAVQVGQQVEAGELVGVVEQPVLRTFKGRPMTMLHLEWMPPGEHQTYWWKLDEPQPPLLNPMLPLAEAAGDRLRWFTMDSYDGENYR